MTSVAEEVFRSRLLEAGLLVESGADGVYLRSEVFYRLTGAIDDSISRAGSDMSATVLHLPPVMGREVLQRAEYV
ncbi:MAG: amino acid--[acyl-carrier-protein] ligase, partial [Acidimicrobiales bacterium]